MRVCCVRVRVRMRACMCAERFTCAHLRKGRSEGETASGREGSGGVESIIGCEKASGKEAQKRKGVAGRERRWGRRGRGKEGDGGKDGKKARGRREWKRVAERERDGSREWGLKRESERKRGEGRRTVRAYAGTQARQTPKASPVHMASALAEADCKLNPTLALSAQSLPTRPQTWLPSASVAV